jgi:hypothetical protein
VFFRTSTVIENLPTRSRQARDGRGGPGPRVSPLLRDPESLKAIANEAVKRVYRHGSGAADTDISHTVSVNCASFTGEAADRADTHHRASLCARSEGAL